MAIQAAAGATLAIGTTAAHSNQTEYEADTYTSIGELESIGEFGDEFTLVSFTGMADARVRKLKGTANAGTLNFSYGFDDDDSGQTALVAAHASTANAEYNFKATYPSGEVRYFSGHVMTLKEALPNADAVLMVNGTIEVNTAVLKVAAP
jgi:hypothetical protein